MHEYRRIDRRRYPSAGLLDRCLGQVITNAYLRGAYLRGEISPALCLELQSGVRLCFEDHGQSCCERRYVTCDDNLDSFIGAVLTGVEVSEVEDRREEDDHHEIAFVRVRTSLGTITVELSHNVHNGYYGGFDLSLIEE